MQLRNRYYDSSSQKAQKNIVDLAKAIVRKEMEKRAQKKVKYYTTKTPTKTSQNTTLENTKQYDDAYTQFTNKAKELIHRVNSDRDNNELSTKHSRILCVKDLFDFLNEQHDYISSQQNNQFKRFVNVTNIKSLELAGEMEGILHQINSKRATRSQTKINKDITVAIEQTMTSFQIWREKFAH